MTITQKLAEILSDVDRSGDFFASGRAEFMAPRLEVDGVGPIALPLLPAQAKQLIKAATRAPYGRGGDTIVDTKVRRTWQIEASRVSISGKHWAKTLDGIVARAAEGLGVGEPVTAELYKLLVYDKGSFFVSHRDTEKAPGMFATLVLALPSQSKGGELVVRHNDREARLDLACEEPSEIAYASFYADCVHEVLPVTSGCRATLVFNLVRTEKGKALQPPSYEAEAKTVTELLRGWAGEKVSASVDTADEDDARNAAPEKLIIPLDHAYTPAELAFDKLKGADAAVARLLGTAAPQAGCDLHLALLTVWESGSAEYNGRENWHYRRGRRDAGDGENASEFDVVEVLDWSTTLSDWRRLDGAATTLGKLPIEDHEVSPPAEELGTDRRTKSELAVLFLKRLQPLHLRLHQPGIFLSPIIKGRLGDPRFPAHTSPIGIPASACCKIKAICASENFERCKEFPFLSPSFKSGNSNTVWSSFGEAGHAWAKQ